ARLSAEAVQRADRTATEALSVSERLRERMADLEKAAEERQGEINSLSGELERLRSEIAAARSALEEERRLRALDLRHAAGRTRHFLTGRLSLLISDARSALDFDPPQIEAARQRLDAARETIAGEVSNSHG